MENSSTPKILVVDDEVEICSLLEKYFEGRYEIALAHDGREALREVKGFQPDCILLDIRMPDMDGMEVLKAVKLSYPKIKTIMVTAVGDNKIAEQCLRRGAFDYLLKPIDLDELDRKVRSACAPLCQRHKNGLADSISSEEKSTL